MSPRLVLTLALTVASASAFAPTFSTLRPSAVNRGVGSVCSPLAAFGKSQQVERSGRARLGLNGLRATAAADTVDYETVRKFSSIDDIPRISSISFCVTRPGSLWMCDPASTCSAHVKSDPTACWGAW